MDFKTNAEINERHIIVNTALNRCGIKAEETSLAGAVKALCEKIPLKYNDNNFRTSFGEYGFKATDYDLITDEAAESARKYLESQKRLHRGFKVYVRIFPTVEYDRKKYFAAVQPELVLWEISGVTAEVANEICISLSEITDFELKVV